MRQGLAAGWVGDVEVVAIGRRGPGAVDEEVELALARVEPGLCGSVGLGRGSVGQGVEELG